jgi:hypothetical protein
VSFTYVCRQTTELTLRDLFAALVLFVVVDHAVIGLFQQMSTAHVTSMVLSYFAQRVASLRYIHLHGCSAVPTLVLLTPSSG